MGQNSKLIDAEACIHCRKCTRGCLFLEKYGIDIGDTEKLRELAYHCFLCGRCSEVCPKGIDGREIVLEMRREQVEKNRGAVPEKGYGMLLWEKQNYRFRNTRHMSGKSVLFPGCNFPSFYPKTTQKLIHLLKECTNIGVLFDCCGKPVAELGLKEKEETTIKELNARLHSEGIEEVIMLCPNCYHFLKLKLDVRIVSIYEKMKELGMGRQIAEDITVFPPCPDRENKEMLEHIKLFGDGQIETIEEAQCCGLGGCAGAKEPDIARDMVKAVQATQQGKVYTYCASCSGNLQRGSCGQVSHILAELLGTNEEPDTGKSLFNRMKTRFI